MHVHSVRTYIDTLPACKGFCSPCTGHDSIQWYSQRILDEIGLEASEANSQGGMPWS